MRLPPLSLTSVVALYFCTPFAVADFDLYSGYWNYAGPPSPGTAYSWIWLIYDGEPTCKEAWNARDVPALDDVSGVKLGVRCKDHEGGCWSGDPAGVTVLEMHFANVPLYHWTIYKDRGNYQMIGSDGKVYGRCIPFPGHDYICSGTFQTIGVERRFRCTTEFTAAQVMAGKRRGLALGRVAAEYNVTAWDMGTGQVGAEDK